MSIIDFPGRYGLRFQGDERPFHPFANLFPLLEAEELRALKDDIARNGLHDPIVLHEGQILDGRNRFLACLGVMTDRRWPDVRVDPPFRFVN
jgi:hypothetical protein